MRIIGGLLAVMVSSLTLLCHGSSARAQSFTVNSVSAKPSTVKPGQTITFSTTVTASANASNYTIALQVFLNNTYLPSSSKLFSGLTFTARRAVTETSKWTIPAGTTPGSYELLAGVFNSSWVWQTGQAIYFTVAATGAVNGACGGANGVAVNSAPTSGLCNAGTASAVAGSGPWTWNCAGGNGGSAAACSAPRAQQKVSGTCGSANGAGLYERADGQSVQLWHRLGGQRHGPLELELRRLGWRIDGVMLRLADGQRRLR